MPAQNIYDNPDFLAGYVTLDRQADGLDGAAEWPVLQQLMPEPKGQRIVDLGCGFGWFSRWAAGKQASSVLGIDISTKMLERAQAETASDKVTYQIGDLDELVLNEQSCDLVFSSLALHYVRDLERLLSTVGAALSPGGSIVFSVEHPIYSAPTTQRFETSEGGDRIWPLNNYLVEGKRVTSWFVDGVVKEHRTVATYVNTVIDAGLMIERIVEFGPSAEEVAQHPERADDLHRPWFLLVRASKPVLEYHSA